MAYDKFQCMSCEHMKVYRGYKGWVIWCYCCHPNQDIIKEYYKLHGLTHHIGRIGRYIIETDGCVRKHAPKWCPLNAKAIREDLRIIRKATREKISKKALDGRLYKADLRRRKKQREKKRHSSDSSSDS